MYDFVHKGALEKLGRIIYRAYVYKLCLGQGPEYTVCIFIYMVAPRPTVGFFPRKILGKSSIYISYPRPKKPARPLFQPLICRRVLQRAGPFGPASERAGLKAQRLGPGCLTHTHDRRAKRGGGSPQNPFLKWTARKKIMPRQERTVL